MHLFRFLVFCALVLPGPAAFAQQLALGKTPFAMTRSAVLELNTDNQGFLLPRITDTAGINALNPPDGMVIYFVPAGQILIRTGGYWQGLPAARSGTLNYLPKFSPDGKTLGISQLLDNGTNVGIGTATPAQKLDVGGNLAFSGALMPGNNAGTLGYLLQSNGANTTPTWVDPLTILQGNFWTTNGNQFNGNADKRFGSKSQTDIRFISDNIERMRLMGTTGYLGIHTETPGNYLEVQGASTTSGVSGLRLTGLGTATPAATNGKMLSVNSNGDIIVTNHSGGTGYIQNQVAANQTADMRISGKALVGGRTTDNGAALQVAGNATVSGNLGIGTDAPNTALDVAGGVAMRMGAYTAGNGANNNITIGNSAFVRVAGPTAAFSLSGIAGGYDGRMIVLYNATDYDMTLTHDAGSTPANRIYCADHTNILLKRKGCATLMYSTADNRWIVVSVSI